MKPATLETGAVVQVPLFVEEGERVKVDTRIGRVHRAREGLSVANRREARRTAIDILYQADLTGRDRPRTCSRDWTEAGREVPPFARELIEGVVARSCPRSTCCWRSTRGVDRGPDGGARPHDPARGRLRAAVPG